MRILSGGEFVVAPDELVCRQSAWPALAATVGLLVAAGVVLLTGITGSVPIWLAAILSSMLLLFATMAASTLWCALRTSNWLLTYDGERLLIKVRSYLNVEFPPDVPHVAEILRTEMHACRLSRVRLKEVESPDGAVSESTVFLDIVLSPSTDVSDLDKCLIRERGLASRRAVWRHHPVSLVEERTIRVEWRGKHARITPGPEEALRFLAPHCSEGDENLELSRPEGIIGRTEMDPRILFLIQQGRILDATLLVERTLGCGVTEARRLVDTLSSRIDASG